MKESIPMDIDALATRFAERAPKLDHEEKRISIALSSVSRYIRTASRT